jgi:hypothetical protein
MRFSEDIYIAKLNFVARENLDPLLQLALQWISSDNAHIATTLYAIGQSIIFGFGVYLIAKSPDGIEYSNNRSANSGRDFLAIIFSLLSAIWCCATPWLLSLHWFPMLLASAYRLECNRFDRWQSFVSHCVFIAVLAIWVWTAGNLAILGCVLAAIWLPLRRSLSALSSFSIPISFIPMILIACCTSVFVTPEYSMPEYPPGARVTTISALQLAPRPLLGKWLEPNPLTYDTFQQFQFVSLLGFLTISGFFLLCLATQAFAKDSYLGHTRQLRKFYGDKRPYLLSMLAVLSFAVLLGGWQIVFSTVHPAIVDLDPLATLYRVIPGFALSPFSFWIFYFAYILLIDLFSSIYDADKGQKLSIVVIANLAAITMFALHHFQPLSLKAQTIRGADDIANSPSGAILRQHGAWAGLPGVAKARDFKNLYRLKSGTDFVASASASPNDSEARLALDGQHATRWRTARPQSKGDFFQLSFEREVEIVRAVFSIQHTPTDFPRSFKVSNLEGETLLTYIDWPGSLRWTSNDYPYYGPQSEVVLDFPSNTSLSGLRLELIAGNQTFDWSIAEIKLYSSKP